MNRGRWPGRRAVRQHRLARLTAAPCGPSRGRTVEAILNTSTSKDDVLAALGKIASPEGRAAAGDRQAFGHPCRRPAKGSSRLRSMPRLRSAPGRKSSAQRALKVSPRQAGAQSATAALTGGSAHREPGVGPARGAPQRPQASPAARLRPGAHPGTPPGGPRGAIRGTAGVQAIIAVASWTGGVGKSTTAVNPRWRCAKSLDSKVRTPDGHMDGPSMPK